jgi:hypothetical protein
VVGGSEARPADRGVMGTFGSRGPAKPLCKFCPDFMLPHDFVVDVWFATAY